MKGYRRRLVELEELQAVQSERAADFMAAVSAQTQVLPDVIALTFGSIRIIAVCCAGIDRHRRKDGEWTSTFHNTYGSFGSSSLLSSRCRKHRRVDETILAQATFYAAQGCPSAAGQSSVVVVEAR